MERSVNIHLANELLSYVNERAGGDDVSGYISDLIRKEMDAEREVMSHIMKGLDDFKNGRFSDKSFLDFKSTK